MEMMKIADHKRFQANGNEFVFMTQTGSIFEIETGSETQAILNHDISQRTFTKQDVYSILKGTRSDKDSLWNDLAKNRVLAPQELPENKPLQHFPEIPLKTLVLHVTEACNLGCHYCYHNPENTNKSLGLNKTPDLSMEFKVAKKAVDFLFEHSRGLEELVLVFFGGEPLLNLNLISKTVTYANEKARENAKTIEYAMTTNGTLLTDKAIHFLNENKIGTTVSLDGLEAVHDRFRQFPDGSPSYKVILPKIKKFLGKENPKPVVARVTLAKDAKDISRTLYHLLGLGFSEVGFAPVTTMDTDFQLDAHQMTSLLEQFVHLSETFINLALKDEFLGFTNLVDLLVTLHEGEVKQYPCGAGIGMFSVDPKGGLFLCQRLTHDDSARMGDIFDGLDREKLGTFRLDAGLDKKSDCKGCWAASICAGGCYHEAKIREGDLLLPNLHYCQWIKTWIATGLNVYGRLMKQAPSFLDKLSMLRGHEPLFNPLV
ncbi:radical SAM/SPASM domain-containing protein [Desulfobacula toluolica]|uniref:QhpX: predicted quinohemoprotein amine dehydrogenase, putative SAM-radical dependent activating subunit n=1 Tax=Desulfobacula toluolica (strain DSM 7467 / Tol2) TaxID=651182 RepID=K0ND35_DESTT|nr:radical SAM protein [Desulfobacula toluolica]CCK78811.1 QhpX: predicted quinohemoprotein amine dehydrogenase, putative SAM-radical dependent activating subunit [Desulfobacula toluolica Tol2]